MAVVVFGVFFKKKKRNRHSSLTHPMGKAAKIGDGGGVGRGPSRPDAPMRPGKRKEKGRKGRKREGERGENGPMWWVPIYFCGMI